MASYRRGMWVMVDNKVGIGAEFYDEIATVHFIGEDGLTYLVSGVPYDEVRQATYEEIPEIRRPTEDVARYYGYL